ncbi:unnamed protein product [Phytomonas sp. EM1]|nr:unnamed protein product [Phytomonas sp. EM1]|eukprot:CCW65582.1 unnamed protein product [Phytomonas sp. isolate EM1]
MSGVELRREVLRLRREVEALQSSEVRLTMELESSRERQAEERAQRQRARHARLQMLQRLQEVVKQRLLPPGDVADTPLTILERSKKEMELVVQRHQI